MKMAELLPLKAYPLTLNIQGTIYKPMDQILFTKMEVMLMYIPCQN